MDSLEIESKMQDMQKNIDQQNNENDILESLQSDIYNESFNLKIRLNHNGTCYFRERTFNEFYLILQNSSLNYRLYKQWSKQSTFKVVVSTEFHRKC